MKSINIVEKYKVWFAISIAVMLMGMAFAVTRGFNYSIEFVGGTIIQLEMGEAVDPNQVRTALESSNSEWIVISAGQNNDEVIIQTTDSLPNDQRIETVQIIEHAFPELSIRVSESDQVAPYIGNEIRRSALLSIIIASALMLVYVSIRFESVFGVAAVVALIHDVLILLSIYAIFGLSVDSSFIAAVLTIVGYSINDTIVLFDRLRENIKREKSTKFFEIANLSVGQTLVRTINTSLTTLLVVGSLFFFGAPAVKQFAFPLMVGVLVGTYSSIFIASPVWAIVRRFLKNRKGYQAK